MKLPLTAMLASALAAYNHALREHAQAEKAAEQTAREHHRTKEAVLEQATKVLPFTTGKDYHIMAADRIARATCLYVEPTILPKNEIGFNAVFLLAGSKSVVCRIDHESLKSMANDEVTTSSVFSRDAITAGYHAARNEPENETD